MVRSIELSGYEQYKTVMAQRYRMGKASWVYLVSLPIQLISTHLPIPNPDEPFPGNRRVARGHAESFGRYWRQNPGKWATPPLLLDTLFPLKDGFEAEIEVAGVEFGRLQLPHNTSAELEILDGQHRILGWKLITDMLATEMKAARTELSRSRSAENAEGVKVYESKIAKLASEQQRMSEEFVTLEILEGITLEEHKQIFSDIANNAKGITKSITVSFDRRSVLNRVAMDLAENNELLAGRVEVEKDRVLGGNENWISGKNLVDIVRHTALGIDGRMTVRREAAMKEGAIADIAEKFFLLLRECFPDLVEMMAENILPSELRERSMLGSPTMLRVLAGVYHELAVDLSDERHAHVISAGEESVRALFLGLADHMGFPVSDGWLETELFPRADAKAPSSRAQDLKRLTLNVAAWGLVGRPFSGKL